MLSGKDFRLVKKFPVYSVLIIILYHHLFFFFVSFHSNPLFITCISNETIWGGRGNTGRLLNILKRWGGGGGGGRVGKWGKEGSQVKGDICPSPVPTAMYVLTGS